MSLDNGSIVLALATFSALGFTISFGVLTITASVERLRPSKLIDRIQGSSPLLPSFSQRLILSLEKDWSRFFAATSATFFLAAILDIVYVLASFGFSGDQLAPVLFADAVLVLLALILITYGWVSLVVSALRYTPTEVEDLLKDMQIATVKAYIESNQSATPNEPRHEPATPASARP